MSLLDPGEKKTDYIVKENKIREFLVECEVPKKFIKAVNQKVIMLLLEADNRRKKNGRKRIYNCDL